MLKSKGSSLASDSPQTASAILDDIRIDIVQTGQGLILNSAALAVWLKAQLSLFPHGTGLLAAPVFVANYGTAGAASVHWDVGQNLLINKVSGPGRESAIYPERLIPVRFPETNCISVMEPQNSGPLPKLERPVYDMEAFATARVTELYLSPGHLIIGKYVLDHLTAEGPGSWEDLVKLQQGAYESACGAFLEHLLAHVHVALGSRRRKVALSAEIWSRQRSEEVQATLPLTSTQGHQLLDSLRQFATLVEGQDERTAKLCQIQELLADREHTTKRGNSQTLSDICELVHSEALLSPVCRERSPGVEI